MIDRFELAITFLEQVGPQAIRYLISHFGTAEAVFNATPAQLSQVEGITRRATAGVLNRSAALARADEEIDFMRRHNITPLFYTSGDYPQRLLQCADFPVLLYYMGKANLNHPRVVSIVGTRNATPYGKDLCAQLITALAAYNVLVVSGLAYGIDGAAHRESLKAGVPTVGVLGHGLQTIYPGEHRDIARKMLATGGLLTEFPSQTGPERYNFPQRNRIIAGLADAVVVVEASAKGGALITAEIANGYNKDVFAFPGRVGDKLSEGCNFLVKTYRAALINSAEDLLYNLDWQPVEQPKPARAPVKLAADEQAIVNALQEADLSVDNLAYVLNMGASRISMLLLTLEMKDIVLCLPGRLYRLK